MIALKTLGKLATGGGIGPDELATICEMAGMAVEFADVSKAESAAAFTGAWANLTMPGAKLVRIEGRMQGGDRMAALIIMVPALELS